MNSTGWTVRVVTVREFLIRIVEVNSPSVRQKPQNRVWSWSVGVAAFAERMKRELNPTSETPARNTVPNDRSHRVEVRPRSLLTCHPHVKSEKWAQCAQF